MLATIEQRRVILGHLHIPEFLELNPGEMADVADHIMHRERDRLAGLTKGDLIGELSSVRTTMIARIAASRAGVVIIG